MTKQKTESEQVRETLGISQSHMAILCNTSVGTIAKWDQGKRQPTGQGILLIKTILWLWQLGYLTRWVNDVVKKLKEKGD